MKLLLTTRALLYYFDPHFMLFLYSVCMSVWSSTGHSVTSVVNKSRVKASRSQFRSPPGRNLLKSGTARLARTLRLTVTCSAVAVPIAAARSPLYYLFCRSLIACSARLCPPPTRSSLVYSRWVERSARSSLCNGPLSAQPLTRSLASDEITMDSIVKSRY